MFSHARVGLVPAHFRPLRRPETRAAVPPPAEERPAEPASPEEAPPIALDWTDYDAPRPAIPEPVARAPEPEPIAPPSYNLTRPRKRWGKEDALALQRCSDALGYVSRCDSACCVRAKRCLWARGGRCFRDAVLPPAKLMWT